ncbi:MAG TPA: serine hydrolase domain-containing protein [Candidatus Polarisedimenticolaceae bacterium]|nr:serine hydrolase domain-containing protein [Candidatus Polarisedimenticolaceae bacterium]
MGPCLAAALAASLLAAPTPRVEGALARRIDRHLSRLVPFGFAGTVLMARGDTVLLHRAYGWADGEARTPETLETLHAIGSLTKAFTAAAVLRLEADGVLRTGDPLAAHLPDVPSDKATITLHQLLTHTAGIVESIYPSGLEAEWLPRTREEAIERILAAPLRFPPGNRFAYSNAGYTLLAAVVERASGQTFETYLRRHVLLPADLEDIGMQAPRWDLRRFPHVMAGDEDRGTLVDRLGLGRKDPPPLWNLVGNSGLQATAYDLYRWVRALRGGRVIPGSAVARMFDGGKHAYGYGWEVRAMPGGNREFRHVGGHYVGTNAEIVVDELTERTMVVLCDRLVDRRVTWTTSVRPLLTALLEDRPPPALPPAVRAPAAGELQRWEGTWGDARGPAFHAEVRSGRLRLRPLREDVTAALLDVNAEDLARTGARALGLVSGLLRGGEAQDPDLGPLVQAVVAPAGADLKVSAGATVPDVGGAFVTTTHVSGSRGEVELHLRWREGAVVALHRKPLTVEVAFLPDARRPGVFAGYHPFLNAGPELVAISGKAGPIALHLGGRAFRRLAP